MESYTVAVTVAEKKLEKMELPLKKPVGTEVLIKVDSVALCTLEQRVYSGVMKYWPFAGGHEFSGIVVEVGPDVKSVKVDDKVAARALTQCGNCHYCRSGMENLCVSGFQASTHEGLNGPGGLAEYVIFEEQAVYKMSDDVDLGHAALVEPLACCVHSIGQAKIELANDVVVMGAGIMGIFHTQLAKLKGARVIVTELNPDRLEVARKVGADVLIDSGKTDPVEKIKELTDGRGADVVICTVPSAAAAAEAIAMAGKRARVVLYTSFHPKNPSPTIPLDLNHVHYSEVEITGSVNPKVVDFYTASRLLSHKLLDPSAVITEEVPFSNLEYAFERALDPASYRIMVKL
ncbi:MAG: alcohol dehydrogenase catalytic domain-containing protein [Clostridiaceae bacterium]|nr:alcohol dehydrogenase catalytic domain-containing protein [Clostridiaceae bacterium]